MSSLITTFQTKKDLREALAKGEDPWMTDHSVSNPRSGRVRELLAARGPFTVTNERRRWFGRLSLMGDGRVRCE